MRTQSESVNAPQNVRIVRAGVRANDPSLRTIHDLIRNAPVTHSKSTRLPAHDCPKRVKFLMSTSPDLEVRTRSAPPPGTCSPSASSRWVSSHIRAVRRHSGSHRTRAKR